MPSEQRSRFFYIKQVGVGEFCSEVGIRILKAALIGALFSGFMELFKLASQALGFASTPETPSNFDLWLRSIPVGVWLLLAFAILIWCLRGQEIHQSLPNFTNGERIALTLAFSIVVLSYYILPWWLMYGFVTAIWELVLAYAKLAERGREYYEEGQWKSRVG